MIRHCIYDEWITSVVLILLFVVPVFFPGFHQSLPRELGQSYLYGLSALRERRKGNGQWYCLLPAGNTSFSTQKHIRVDQSRTESASVISREGSPMSGVLSLPQVTSTTSRLLSSRSEVFLQELQYLRYQTAAKCYMDKLLMDLHPDAKSMPLWDFYVLTLAFSFISWHKLEEFAVVPVNRTVSSQGRQFSSTTIIQVVILSFPITDCITLCSRGTTQGKKCHTTHSLRQNLSYINSQDGLDWKGP